MLVKELMSPDPIYCAPQTTLHDLAVLMKENDCGAIPVCEGQHVVGIVTDRNLVTRGLARDADPQTLTASEVMTRNLMVVHDDDPLERALTIMESEQVRRLPVVQGPVLVGLLSMTDLAEHLSERKAGELLREVSEKPRRARMAL
jgi:CBS domain-containing protein